MRITNAQLQATVAESGPSTVDLTVYQGDTEKMLLTFVDDVGNPTDITGWTILSQIRDDYIEDGPALAEWGVEITGTNTAELTLTNTSSEALTYTKSNLYAWDIKTTDTNNVTTTFCRGSVTVIGTSTSPTVALSE